MSIFFVFILGLAVLLLFGTMAITLLKNLQRSRFPQWTFLDYLSVGYARHLYLKYILRK